LSAHTRLMIIVVIKDLVPAAATASREGDCVLAKIRPLPFAHVPPGAELERARSSSRRPPKSARRAAANQFARFGGVNIKSSHTHTHTLEKEVGRPHGDCPVTTAGRPAAGSLSASYQCSLASCRRERRQEHFLSLVRSGRSGFFTARAPIFMANRFRGRPSVAMCPRR
jgi:hypothetical protein